MFTKGSHQFRQDSHGETPTCKNHASRMGSNASKAQMSELEMQSPDDTQHPTCIVARSICLKQNFFQTKPLSSPTDFNQRLKSSTREREKSEQSAELMQQPPLIRATNPVHGSRNTTSKFPLSRLQRTPPRARTQARRRKSTSKLASPG